ncbi:MAG: toluene tolerance protein [Henriciella sp.]|jgi:phospholipid transport system substrate-binding protein|uniref:MlaC/ttg2D family ABC transporter substrate-binding protein n=1 Tax=Henriciella sp. TaxID=1968823 RepID=UPI000C1214B6|nr:ABC transporter substrate-binding protein [Henriciella sp.]MAN72483.1 toluene tolerance protein [Henriciella sp.]MBF32959.1 toluene tolerance protein [Hyphomonadaceae bacterium]MBK74781.1 toluene tolerance protein [Henriciella sp.]PHR77115.1 MAG: toluene tolerance protein [Henriciella sp.]|tara:strand:- start:1966 stop:2586 length:621 start_codon:yes stop_codon:yes gene_type:complete
MKIARHLIAAAALAAAASPAFADASTEAFVEDNANEVLESLNDPSLSRDERTALFSRYMDEFADIEAVSRFVIGKYANRFTPEEFERFQAAFKKYALAVYENELDAYRGNEVIVEGSTDRTPRDSIVDTKIPRADGQEMSVRWRVLKRNDGYQVVDVALNVNGNLIWLAIEQQAQFLSLLDRTNGSVDALINRIERMTRDVVAGRR